MALRDQPYIPLYVQDFLTDEKLNECSAESTGVYIRLMCVMHKSQEYGVVLLKQKDKQTGKQITDFALKLVKQMPYSAEIIERSLIELLEEGVLTIDGDRIFQKRMVRDGKLSDIKAYAGSKGGKSKQNNKHNASSEESTEVSKIEANTENEIEYENDTENDSEGKYEQEPQQEPRVRRRRPSSLSKVQESRFNRFWIAYPRKLSIADAEKAWKKIDPDERMTAAIIAAIGTAKRYDSRFREMKYTPYPASWLNSRSWENQYDGPEERTSELPLGRNTNAIGVLERMLEEGGG